MSTVLAKSSGAQPMWGVRFSCFMECIPPDSFSLSYHRDHPFDNRVFVLLPGLPGFRRTAP